MPGEGTRVKSRSGHVDVRSVWGFTGALLAIVLGLGVFVGQLHHQADVHRQAQALASELEADSAELEVAEVALETSELGTEAAYAEISDELGDLHAKLTVLRGLNDESVVSAIERDLLALETALRTQVRHLRVGDLEAADEVDEQRTDPAFAAFDARVESAHTYFATAAGRSSTVSGVGLWLALLIAGVAIGGLSWRYERARRSSERALEERLRERVAEVAAITEEHRQLEAMKYSFVSAVSHELRTPLTAIHGSLEMLEDGDLGRLPPAAVRGVSVAARGTRRLTRLVEDVIDLERLESGHFGFYPAPHDLYALLLEGVESLAPLTEHAGIELVFQETHANVLCDGDRVLQALVNLIGNAIKYTSPGGSIHLETVCLGEEVEVTVRDEGRGIPADQLGAVFDRFHQVDTEADQAKGGAGLGLAITRHIIEAHGGRIWVESKCGAGAAFRFTLPLALPEPDDAVALAEPTVLAVLAESATDHCITT